MSRTFSRSGMSAKSRAPAVAAVGLAVMMVSVLCTSALVPGCSRKDAGGPAGSLVIAGSTALQPLVDQAAKQFMANNTRVQITVNGGGSGAGILYPGTFTASCQTKNSTVVFAAQLMLDIIEGMHNGDVSEADLKMAKTARINAFPSMFQGTGAILQEFARLEFEGRPMDYFEKYVARYEKVTLDDIKRVAKKWLRPDQMVILVAGNIEECKAGADNLLPNQPTIERMAQKFGGRTLDGLARKYGDGTIHVIPLRRPAEGP